MYARAHIFMFENRERKKDEEERKEISLGEAVWPLSILSTEKSYRPKRHCSYQPFPAVLVHLVRRRGRDETGQLCRSPHSLAFRVGISSSLGSYSNLLLERSSQLADVKTASKGRDFPCEFLNWDWGSSFKNRDLSDTVDFIRNISK